MADAKVALFCHCCQRQCVLDIFTGRLLDSGLTVYMQYSVILGLVATPLSESLMSPETVVAVTGPPHLSLESGSPSSTPP